MSSQKQFYVLLCSFYVSALLLTDMLQICSEHFLEGPRAAALARPSGGSAIARQYYIDTDNTALGCARLIA